MPSRTSDLTPPSPIGPPTPPSRRRRASGARSAWKPRLEKAEQRGIIDCFKRLGIRVYSTSQYRASHVSVGIPDLWCVYPAKGLAWWWESKRYQRTAGYSPFDRSTWVPEPWRPEQARFAEECHLGGVLHGWGGLAEAMAFVVALGVAQWSAGQMTVCPK